MVEAPGPGGCRVTGAPAGVNVSGKTAPHAPVAIVVRTRNRPVLLARALDSVLGQTYQDYVAVVVNDDGDRPSVEQAVANAADRARGRIHLVHNAVSRGREAAMNIGLHASSSTYVVIHDDDDTWAPTFLERTVAHLEQTGQQGVATRTEVVYERIDGDIIVIEGGELLASDKHEVTLLDTIGRNYTAPISFLYRREVIGTIGEYDATLPVLADWDFLLRFLRLFEVGFIDGEPLAYWHHRRTSVGDEGNSVHAGASEHIRWDVLIRDRYLRADLAAQGGLGDLLCIREILDRDQRIAQDRGAHLAGALHDVHTMTANLAGAVHHLHASNSTLIGAVQDLNERTHDEVIHQLVEMNRNLVSQGNRMVAQFDRLGARVDELERALSQPPVRSSWIWRAAGGRSRRSVDRSP